MHRLIYLHGFASGPQSSKAQFFRERFKELGRNLEIPDLTAGDFEHTTLTRQLNFLGNLAGTDSCVLIGSSMGAYMAALFAARHPERVPGVVLMAPAFGLSQRWVTMLGDDAVREWKERGWRPVYHYGENREARIGYDLMADGLSYEEFPGVRQSALVLHGRRDESVDYRLSERFAENRPNVELVLYDSDHQLLDMLEPMWERVRDFAV